MTDLSSLPMETRVAGLELQAQVFTDALQKLPGGFELLERERREGDRELFTCIWAIVAALAVRSDEIGSALLASLDALCADNPEMAKLAKARDLARHLRDPVPENPDKAADAATRLRLVWSNPDVS